jgi:hypothetical protein
MPGETIGAPASRDGGPPGRQLPVPIGAISAVSLVVIALRLLTLWSVSVPGWHVATLQLAVITWPLVGLVWWPLSLVVGITAGDRVPPRQVLAWVAVPAVLLLTLWLAWQHAPVATRIALAHGVMDRQARQIAAHPDQAATVTRLGLFGVHGAEVLPGGGVRFPDLGQGWGGCGLAYLPSGPPGPGRTGAWSMPPRYEHRFGSWYEWCEPLFETS